MLGQDVARSPTGTFLRRSLRPAFARLRSTLRRTSALLCSRDPYLEAAFRSPTANASFRMLPRQGQRSRPASSIQHRDFPAARSVALSGPVSFRDPGLSTIAARCRLPAPARPSLFRLSLPVGVFAPSDRSAQPFSTRTICLCDRPDFPSLPEIVPCKLPIPDHRFRSATVRQAHCPMNLLEPSTACL